MLLNDRGAPILVDLLCVRDDALLVLQGPTQGAAPLLGEPFERRQAVAVKGVRAAKQYAILALERLVANRAPVLNVPALRTQEDEGKKRWYWRQDRPGPSGTRGARIEGGKGRLTRMDSAWACSHSYSSSLDRGASTRPRICARVSL